MCAAVKNFSIGHFDLNPRGNLWANDEGGVCFSGWGGARGEDGPPTIVRGNAEEETKKSVVEAEEAPSKMPPNEEEGCLSLPSPVGRRYDAWLESQRAAARMKAYRAMVRALHTHPVLRTANLLRLKGYGNWG